MTKVMIKNILLPEQAYLSGYEVLRETSSSLVHVADVHTYTGKIQAVVKCFPSFDFETEKKAVRNELAAYMFASEARLPIAEEAHILIVKREILLSAHRSDFARSVLTRPEYIAWLTKAIPGAPIRYIHQITEAEMKKRLLKWAALADVLAFDDWLLNEDRTNDNLIAVRGGNFYLIDHADIAGGVSRGLGLVSHNQPCKNLLLEHLFESNPPKQIKSGMILAAQDHKKIFDTTTPRLENLLKELSLKDHDSDALIELLYKRAVNSQSRIIEAHRMLI